LRSKNFNLKTKTEPKIAGIIRFTSQIDETAAITAKFWVVTYAKKVEAVILRTPTSKISSDGSADWIKNRMNTIMNISNMGIDGISMCITR
jgi:hypothetical protein